VDLSADVLCRGKECDPTMVDIIILGFVKSEANLLKRGVPK